MDQSQFTKFVDDAGGILVNKNTGNVTLIKMPYGVWGFPKGKIDKGEATLQAAKREVLEETGIKEFELVKKLPKYSRPNSGNPKELITMYFYLFKTEEEKLKPAKNDVSDAKWVKQKDVLNSLSLPRDKEYFKKIKKLIL